VHFGLGSLTKADRVEIHWPDGLVQQVENPPIDRILIVSEGKPVEAAR
jgi:hypothetical protein